MFPCTRAWAERSTDVQCVPHPSSGVSEKYAPIGWRCHLTNLHDSPKSYHARPLQRRASKLGRVSRTPFPGLATGPARAVCCKAGVISSLGGCALLTALLQTEMEAGASSSETRLQSWLKLRARRHSRTWGPRVHLALSLGALEQWCCSSPRLSSWTLEDGYSSPMRRARHNTKRPSLP